MWHLLRVQAALSLCLGVCTAAGAETLLDREDWKPAHGPYEVGFQYSVEIDNGRNSGQTLGRRLLVGVWYPARVGPDASRMDHIDYRRIEHLRRGGVRQVPTREQYLEIYRKKNAHHSLPERVEALIQLKMRAVRDAPPLTDKAFPLLLYAGGGSGSTTGNFMLKEYLASHGYVVLSASEIQLDQPGREGDWPRGERLVGDLEWLLAKAAGMANVDRDKIGAFGLSYGTMPVTMLAARNPAIDCIASHDGSIAWAEQYVEHGINPDSIRIPYLQIDRGLTVQTDWPNQRDGFYKALLYAPAWRFVIPQLQHSDFSIEGVLWSWSLKPESYEMFEKRWVGEALPVAGKFQGFRLYSVYTKLFFDACLKDDASARNRLAQRPEDNGFGPEAFSHRSMKTPLPLPPDRETFTRRLLAGDFDWCRRQLTVLAATNPDYRVFSRRDLRRLQKKIERSDMELDEAQAAERAELLEALSAAAGKD